LVASCRCTTKTGPARLFDRREPLGSPETFVSRLSRYDRNRSSELFGAMSSSYPTIATGLTYPRAAG
jgi:hypothetical protein